MTQTPTEIAQQLTHELTVKNAIGIHEILLENSHNYNLIIPITYERLFVTLSNGDLPKLEGKESAIKYSGGSALISASGGKRATIENLLNAYFHLSMEKDGKEIEISDEITDLIPANTDLTVLFKSTKADYGLSGDLVYEYSRQSPKIAEDHSNNLLAIAFKEEVERVYLVGEGATRLIRSPYPVVSHALKVLCLLKTVIVDGIDYNGVNGALELEIRALVMTETTRGKGMLKGFISPRPSTVEKNGLDYCITQALGRIPESLRIWSMSFGTFDGYKLAYYFKTIVGEAKIPLPIDRVMKKIIIAERKINEELQQYGIPYQEIINKDFLADILSSGKWERSQERRCTECNRIVQNNWKRCPYEEA